MRVQILKVAALLALAFVLMNVIYWRANTVSYAYNPNNLIRLHVIANSDSRADQDLKTAVAAAIRAEMQGILGGDPGRLTAGEQSDRAWELLHASVPQLETALARTLARWPAPQTGRVELGVFPFPARSYGDTPIPAGMYRAVRITLGTGGGSNWWCILFPPLCLVDPAAGPSGRQPDLQSLEILLAEDELDEANLEVRWAVLELLRGLDHMTSMLRARLSGLLRQAHSRP